MEGGKRLGFSWQSQTLVVGGGERRGFSWQSQTLVVKGGEVGVLISGPDAGCGGGEAGVLMAVPYAYCKEEWWWFS